MHNIPKNPKSIKPNHTQLPNFHLDHCMPFLKDSEWKLLCYIDRRTFGFQKTSDKISFTQFQFGLKDKDGKHHDYGSGVRHRSTIVKGLQTLIDLGLITKKEGRIFTYHVVLDFDEEKMIERIAEWFNSRTSAQSELVRKVNQTSAQTEPKLVRKVNTQKKGKKVIKRKTTATETVAEEITSKDHQDIVDVIDLFGEHGVNAAFKGWYANTNQRKAITSMLDLHGKDMVCKVISLLPKTNATPYFPNITTPHQLHIKWTDLENALKRRKNQFTANTPQVVL